MDRIKLYNYLGEEINLDSLGLVGLKLEIPSPSYRVKTEVLDGRAGELVIEKILDARSLVASFMVTSSDYVESLASRDRLYELIGNDEVLYVAESKQPYKRWKVHADGWTPERVNSAVSLFQVPLFAESGTSETINAVERTFTTSTFFFKNEGNLFIDPRIHSELEIEFTGASTNLIIRNSTTGDEWSYSGSSILGDVILLKGVRSLKNNVSIFGQTNKKLITLTPGRNEFEVIGATGDFEVTIRSRFYFL